MATIHDVAQDAGVSPTTVSRYLNNRIELPPATSARIDAAIKKLDYRPNLLAKRLSTGKSEAVGLVTPEIREPFFSELASAFEDEADRHGYTVFMSQWVSHRDPRFFPEPEEFRPERWLDGLAKRLPKYAYYPFGGGPRVCIGNTFALMEAAILLAAVGQQYRFTLTSDEPAEFNPQITLLPKDGIPAVLKRRK